jgi:hypothetical protein
MDQAHITGDMTVAEVLARVPGAIALFQKYGIHPVTYCGPTIQILRMDETPAHCKLQNLEGLMAELNAAIIAGSREQGARSRE